MSDIPDLSRPAFSDGQFLTADDLSGLQTYHQQLLWLHQRTMHDWGVVTGLTVSGAKGATTCTAAPGFAIDSLGRSIVVSDPVELAVPAVAGGATGGAVSYFLTASYLDDADLPAVDRAGPCDPAGAVRRSERARIRWQQPSDRAPSTTYRFGLDIVLATVDVLNCTMAAAPAPAARRSALPERQPYIYAGQSPVGGTTWKVWTDATGAQQVVGIMADVDTTEAGFASAPIYQASVLGTRIFPSTVYGTILLEGHAQVTKPSPTGFTIQMALPPGPGQEGLPICNPIELLTEERLADFISDLPWYVGWAGVEG